MNTGEILVFAAFGAGGAALAAYAVAWAGNRPALGLARSLHIAMTAALAIASFLLMAAILGDNLGITYVAKYSSREMPIIYKVAAFWAGQAGTILLWCLLQGLAGLALLSRRDSWEAPAMTFLLIPQTLLTLILVKLQPFAMSPAPPTGSGLNPLLQDPWMAIHPPIVFLGYAVLVIPFALSLAAAATKRDADWAPRALPWVLGSILTLGLGLFIGGFWAYKVLGWGGYWGWDPVENSSLAPWMVAVALGHSLLMQKATGALRRTNLVLGALAYALAIYSTYLTRSGILADFSVHSFADGGINTLLVVLLASTTLLPAALVISRSRSIESTPVRWDLSLSPMMTLAVVALMAGTALLVVGTSWPIISGLTGQPASPGPGFYNSASLPVGVGIVALLAAAPLMGWGPAIRRSLTRQVAIGLAVGLLAAGAPVLFGLWPKGGFLVLLLLAFAVAALVASLMRFFRQVRVSPLITGAAISHAGLALMFIGIVTTSAFDSTESVVLQDLKPVAALGHELTLKAYRAEATGTEPHFEIDVTAPGGRSFLATPIMFNAQRWEMMIARPHIERSLLEDFYIAPVSYQPPENPMTPIVLGKGEPHRWGDSEVTFTGFRPHTSDEGGFTVIANLLVERAGQSETAALSFSAGPQGMTSPWVELPLVAGAAAKLEGMKVESGTINVVLRAPDAAPRAATLSVDVSRKPVVNALWLGIIVLTIGTGIAAWQRAREARALASLPIAPKSRSKKASAIPPGMVPLSRKPLPRS